MYRIFIVDDEQIVRQALRNFFDNKDGRYAICGEASDGELAFPMIQELKPDILITDICMPFVDGLKLSEMVKKAMPWIRILILSGHDEFNYAKKAISVGVDDFILKPFTGPQLLESLDHAAGKIEKERREYFDKKSQGDEESLTIRKEHFFNNLVSGWVDVVDAFDQAQQLGIALAAKKYVVCCVANEDSSPLPCLRTVCFKMLGHMQNVYWFVRGEKILLIATGAEEEQTLDSAYSVAQILKHEVHRILETRISIGIGSVVDRLSELSRSYKEAEQALYGHVCVLHGQIVSVGDLSELSIVEKLDPNLSSLLSEKLRHADCDDVDGMAAAHFSQTDEKSQESFLYRHYLIMDLVASAKRMLQNAGADQQALMKQLGNDQITARIQTYEGTCVFAKEILQRAIQLRGNSENGRYGEEIRRAKEYIKTHYCDQELSLNTAAAHVGFSPNHFSTVFSQQMGETFVEYLTRYRVEQGKRMLEESTRKLSDIAYDIGYSEPHYFSYIFKKHTGMTPSGYREQRQKARG